MRMTMQTHEKKQRHRMKVRMIKTVSVYQRMMANKEMSGKEQYRAFADDE